MKYQLYYYPGNANLAPHIVLEEAGCEVELVLVDRAARAQKSAEYLQLNPNGRIPTLVCGDLVVFEAAAICVHVAEQHPEARLLPPLGALQRAHFFQWLMFLSNTVQPAFMAFRYPEYYTTDPAGHDGVRSRAVEQLEQAFAVIEQELQAGPFLLGRYSACDAYLLMVTWWAARRLPESPLRWPRLRACIEAVRARPATQRACRAEGIELSFERL
jgi:glutathione S-transferase